MESKKEIICKKRKEIEERYGKNWVIYGGSGEGVNWEEKNQYLKNLRINLNPKILRREIKNE